MARNLRRKAGLVESTEAASKPQLTSLVKPKDLATSSLLNLLELEAELVGRVGTALGGEDSFSKFFSIGMLSGDLLGVRVLNHFFKASTTTLRPTLVFYPDVIDLDGCLPADSTILPAKCLESCGSLPSFAATSASHKLFLLTRAVLSSKSFKRPPYLHARSSKVKDKSAFRTDTLLARQFSHTLASTKCC